MSNKRTEDSQYEGRDKYDMDIDRMVNEGMAGGAVHRSYKQAQIEEAIPLMEQEPPHRSGKQRKNDDTQNYS
ncbi:hypothetical protein [Guptibacillus hwajinpoensis]|uniref:hypothetical protein n=1 Tax=Guptibacillus hwajinpoensis TaxID=208199 RepID=UPI001CFDA31D|nr:hypothetical protein [Pseudalkalibacillus hwajinpoensis]WLR58446.1 hypothetical protein LC071_14815 [Pseudalkalibacillus hwajinpoensis]